MSIRELQKNRKSGGRDLKPSSAPSRLSFPDKLSQGLIPAQKFIEAILDHVHYPVFIKDRKHRWVVINKAVSELLGFYRKKMLGKSDYDFFPKGQADLFWKKDEEIFRTGKIKDIPEELITDKKGKIHHFHIKKAPLRDSSGKITHLVGLIEKIPERKQVEEELKTIKEQLEFILGVTKTGVDIIDSKFNIRYIDPEWQKIYGDSTGIKCYKYFMGRSRVCPGCGIVTALKTKKPTVTEEVLVKEGNRPIQVTTIPFRNERGEWLVAEANVDISERKRQESALRESEEKYRLLVENIKEGIYSTHKGVFTSVNESMCQMFGYGKDELIGMPAWNLAVPELRNQVKEMFFEKTAKKDYSVVEIKCIRKDGSVFLAEIRLSAISEKHQFMGVVSDITDRKRVNEVLKESEEKYRNLFESASESIVIVGLDGVILDCNKEALKISRLTREALVGKHFTKLGALNEKDMPRAREFFSRILAGESPKSFEINATIGGNRSIWVEVFPALLKKAKRVYAFQVITRDITQRKRAEQALLESEEKYRLLVENANEAIVVAQGGWLKFVNPIMTEVMGYSKQELLSKPFVEFIHPDDRKLVLERHIKRIKGEELPHVYPFKIIDKDGNIKWLEINAVVITWEGRPATLNFLSDITERKHMEKQLVQKEQTARERARLMTDLHNLYQIDDILTRVCEAVRDSGLFERAVMTLHEPGGKIINLGQVGLPSDVVKKARQAPPIDQKLKARITSKKFRISDSFFIPVETGLDLTKSDRHIPQKRRNSACGSWQAGDELFVPLRDFSGEIMGYLSVDTPLDGCRPDMETIQALEMIVEAAAARVRELEANNAVQSSERKYRTLVETAQVGIGIMDPDTNLVFVNQALADLLGYRKEEFLGKKLKDICDETQYAAFKNEMEKRKKGESSKYEAKLLTKSGMSKHVYVSSAPLRAGDGSFMGSLTILSDLTEIKKAREYNILLNASRAFSQTLKFDQVLKMGTEKMMETLHAERCVVLLTEDHIDDPPTRLQVYHSKDTKLPASIINLSTTKEYLSVYRRTLQSRGYIKISDARTDPIPELGKRILRQAGMKSSLIIPIILGKKMLAILHVGLAEKNRTFSPEDVGLVQTMANQVATALQNCRLMEDLERNHAQILQQAELLKTQYREQKMLYELTQALSSSLYLDQLLRVATQKTTELLNTERSSILLLNPDGKTATIRAIHTQGKPSPSEFVGFTFDSDNFPMVKRVLAQKKLVNIPDVQALPKENPLRKYHLSRGIKSTAAVPLICSGKFLGFITVATTKELHSYTPQEIYLLQTMSNPIAMTIENKLLLEDLKGQTEKLKNQTQEKDILLKVSQSLSQTMDLHEVTKVAAQVVGTALRADRCAVSLITPDGNYLEVKGIYSEDQVDVKRLIHKQFAILDEPKWKAIIAKRKVFVTDNLLSCLFGSKMKEYYLQEKINSVLANGMFFGKKLIGVLSISFTKRQQTFTQEEKRLIQSISNQIAVAIENARLMEVVKKHTQDLKELSSQLMKVQENERKRIARELHDEVGQMLQSMKMNLDRIKRNLNLEPEKLEETKDWLMDTEKLLAQTIDDIRTLTFDLRPSMLDDFGLISTLRWYIDDFAKRSNIHVVLKGKEEKCRFPLEIEINLYRIIQEALTNVAKHAQATEVSIFLSQKDSTSTGERLSTAILSLKDNGIGFDASTLLSYPQKGMGIFNMKERVNLLGGSFEIISRPHKGTRVNVKIPFTEVKHEEG